MFLDADELISLTQRQRPSAQLRVLRYMGIEYKTRPDGSLAVLKDHVEHLLGGATPAKPEKEFEPDWSAI